MKKRSTFLTLALCALCPLPATQYPLDVSGQILYWVHRGKADEALSRYLECVNLHGDHDFSLLQQIGFAMLEEGAAHADPEIVMMSLLGAGVSNSLRLLPILEKGIKNENPQIQLIALNFLSRIADDTTDDILVEALGSQSLMTRLEALYQLSLKRHPMVLDQLQSLFVKIPPAIRPLFCQILINLDSTSANQMMRQLLSDQDLFTRCEAVAAVANKKRDDFLPQIKRLGSQTQVLQQECVAATLGLLKDRSSQPLLEQLAHSKQSNVALTAASSLYQLGNSDHLPLLYKAAGHYDLLAIALLSEIPTPTSIELLALLLKSTDKDVQLGAALSLLELQDPRSWPYIKEIICSERQAIGYVSSRIPGRLTPVWKTVLAAPFKEPNYPGIMAQTHALRSQLLIKCVDMKEEAFLDIAEAILDLGIKSLVPTLTELLVNHRSEKSIALIKKHHQQNNSEFVKTSCLLALYRLHESGPYEEELVKWVKKRHHHLLIKTHTQSSEQRLSEKTLAAEDESALLIHAFEALAASQNEAGIEALLQAIAYGNLKNRYALAGLLIRTAE